MSKFLTCQEYENLASQLHYPTLAFIDGKFVPAASGKTFVTGNPATGKELAHIASCGKEDVDRAVAVARKTFESGVWSKMHPTERKKYSSDFAA